MQIAQTSPAHLARGPFAPRDGQEKPERWRPTLGFVEGAVARGVSALRAGQIFDLIENSRATASTIHSAAYAMLAYQTAWLKAHYRKPSCGRPVPDMEHTERGCPHPECEGIGLEVLPPDIIIRCTPSPSRVRAPSFTVSAP